MKRCSKSNLWAKSDVSVKNNLWGRFGLPKVAKVMVKKQLWGRFGVPKVAKSDGGLLKKHALGNSRADPADPAETVSGTAARASPSTRAGGQDDGSSTNSLKKTRQTRPDKLISKFPSQMPRESERGQAVMG